VTAATPDDRPQELRRSIGPVQMALYGVGSMLGAGIYGLVGEAAARVGSAVWLAFAVAMVTALLTGLSYATLGSRYPKAGGAAHMTDRAYRRPMLTFAVGLSVTASGLTSMAAGARVIGENLAALPPLAFLPATLIALVVLLAVAGVVYAGIRESMGANIFFTLVEAGGLIFIIAIGMRYWGETNLMETPQGTGLAELPILLIVQGAALTFFSFIGFEDSLNVAEECKQPRTTVPIGMISAMLVTAVLYMAVAITAVSVIPWRELGQSPAPLARVADIAAPWLPGGFFVAITIFAVANTALLNFITASRLLFGMARDGHLPGPLAKVHPRRRTPHVAIGLLLVIALALALLGDISQLAEATVLLLLVVFTIVNGALVVLKLRPGEPKGAFEAPLAVPIAGAVVCAGMLLVRVSTGDWRAPATAAGIVIVALVLYAWIRVRMAGRPG
jgi:amino acid transporter